MMNSTVLGLVGADRLAAHPDAGLAGGKDDTTHFTNDGATYITNTIISLLSTSGSHLANFIK